MEIRKPKSVKELYDMKDHLVLLHEDKEHYLESVAQRLIAVPDSILILQGRDDNNELVCMLVAEKPRDNSEYIWLSQVWSSDPKLTDELMMRVMLWAISLGRNEIRGETKRNPKPLHKKFGFELHSVILSLKINEKIITDYTKLFKEVQSGRLRRTKH